MPRDLSERPFVAKLTARATVGGSYVYSWLEQVPTTTGTTYADANPGRSGTPAVAPAYEDNNKEVAVGTFVWMRKRSDLAGIPIYSFAAPAGATPGLTVKDGTNTFTGIDTLKIDVSATSGLGLVTNPTTGEADLHTIAATATQAGIVTTGVQRFAGIKTFTANAVFEQSVEIDGILTMPIVGEIILGVGNLGTGGAEVRVYDAGPNFQLRLRSGKDAIGQVGEVAVYSDGSLRLLGTGIASPPYLLPAADTLDLGLTGTTDKVSVDWAAKRLKLVGSAWAFMVSGATGQNGTDALGNVFTGGICTVVGAGSVGSGTVTHTGGALTANRLVIGNGSDDITIMGAGTNGQVVVGQTGAAPLWKTLSGDATMAADGTLTIGAAKVTLAKIANAGANSKLLGSGAAGSGASYSEISLGTNLSMSGTTLNAASSLDITGLSASDVALTDEFPFYDTSAAANKKLTYERLAGFALRSVADGRLTLESGIDASTSDQSAKTTLYYTPSIGTRIALYDGTRWKLYTFSEVSLASPTLTSGLPYDVWLFDAGGGPQLEVHAWTNATTRATSLTSADGVLTKNGDATRRYLGTILPSAANQMSDTAAFRGVWNLQNQMLRSVAKTCSGSGYTYSTNTWRASNNDTANKIDYVCGLAEQVVAIGNSVYISTTASQALSATSVGVNNTTGPYSTLYFGAHHVATGFSGSAYHGLPRLGANAFTSVERGAGAGTQTWFPQGGACLEGFVPC